MTDKRTVVRECHGMTVAVTYGGGDAASASVSYKKLQIAAKWQHTSNASMSMTHN